MRWRHRRSRDMKVTWIIALVLYCAQYISAQSPNPFNFDSKVCYNLDIGTTRVKLDDDVLAIDNNLQLTRGQARLSRNQVST